MNSDAIAEKILSLCRDRGPDKTICPSEVARALIDDGKEWQRLMADVRHAASDLANKDLIDVCQKGAVVDIDQVQGPIRLRIRP